MKVVEVAKIEEGDDGKRIYNKNGFPKVVEDTGLTSVVEQMVEDGDTLIIYDDMSFIEIVSDDSEDVLIQRGIHYIE